MSQSARPRLADLRAVHRLTHECRDLGDSAVEWRSHLATQLGRLVGAGFVTAADMAVSNGVPFGYSSAGEYGWENGFSLPAFERLTREFVVRGMAFCPLIEPYTRARQAEDGVALSRKDLVPDSRWYGTEYHREYHTYTGSETLLYCFRQLPAVADRWCALTLTRLRGEPDFTPRQKAVVREANAVIAPLVGGPLAKFDEPSPSELPRRVRQVLACLLEGDSDKQIAARLGLSIYTVKQYLKSVFRHFGVDGKGELFARWVKRGWGRGGWADGLV